MRHRNSGYIPLSEEGGAVGAGLPGHDLLRAGVRLRLDARSWLRIRTRLPCGGYCVRAAYAGG